MRPDLRDIEDRLGMTAEFGGRISLDRHEAEEIANALAQARKVAAASFRPDLYRAALVPAGETVPAEDRKDEGVHLAPYVMPAAGGLALPMAADLRAPGLE